MLQLLKPFTPELVVHRAIYKWQFKEQAATQWDQQVGLTREGTECRNSVCSREIICFHSCDGLPCQAVV